ncbi:LysR family transcriptional regulator [Stigmatella sp. ncwal1]|uniref:LysR family transcriptional regulator n=1 Tax=Stigmatella ashevillensis TaxID=2995309 RepID=A0ABT5DJ15_9BACT|nr:LysR family transcriptional regulator [Stigmatella ashevillena]MDC0713632.1 LysR family transcriptional regulator [Stigmatella ashevillena]
MPRDINLNRIEIFREVALSGSFTKAALTLKQPKSRVSRNISALESELGVQLIHRSSRHFRLTEAGRVFYARMQGLMEQVHEAINELTETTNEVAGPIRISVAEDIGHSLMSHVCHDFLKQYPKVQVELHLTNDCVEALGSSFDLAVRVGRLKDSAALQRKVGETYLLLVASPVFLREYGELPRDPTEFIELPFLGFSRFGSFQQQLSLVNGGVKRQVKVKIPFLSNDLLVLKSMAMKGMGLAWLPSFILRDELHKGTLVHVFRGWTSQAFPIQIVLPPRKDSPLRIKRFVDFVAAALQKEF